MALPSFGVSRGWPGTYRHSVEHKSFHRTATSNKATLSMKDQHKNKTTHDHV